MGRSHHHSFGVPASTWFVASGSKAGTQITGFDVLKVSASLYFHGNRSWEEKFDEESY